MSDQQNRGHGAESQDALTDEETVRRRDDALRRALNTPPTPHKAPRSKAKSRAVPKGRSQKGKGR